MSAIQTSLAILLVDKDANFAKEIKNMLAVRSNGVQFHLDWDKKYIKNHKTYDVIILDGQTLKEEVIEVLNDIKNHEISSRVVLIGECTNNKILQKLINFDIKCFSDKQGEEIELLFDEIKDEAESKYRVTKIQNSLRKLEEARSSLKLSLNQ